VCELKKMSAYAATLINRVQAIEQAALTPGCLALDNWEV
jgi:hypothetical protein